MNQRPNILGNSQLLVLAVFSFWSVWVWYAHRISDGTFAPYSLLPLLLLLVLFFLQRDSFAFSEKQLFWPSLFAVSYGACFFFAPPLVKGLFAFLTLATLVSLYKFGKTIHLGVFGLAVLSLPVLSSLEFYCSYPLRLVVANVAGLVLRFYMPGIDQEGLNFVFDNQIVSIDDPCSGIKMLWVTLLMSSLLCVLYKLNTLRSIGLFAMAILMALVANILRSLSLFYVETGLIQMPHWGHNAVGVACFIFVVGMIILYSNTFLFKSKKRYA